MKTIIVAALCLLAGGSLLAQHDNVKSKKLTKVEAADMTREQRLIHESERKSKKNHRVSTQKKVKMAKKTDRKLSGGKTARPKAKKRRQD